MDDPARREDGEAPADENAPKGRVLRPLARIAMAIGLLALVIGYAQPREVLDVLHDVHPPTFLLAFVVAIASNVVSAIRWAAIARASGLRAPNAALIGFYARAMAANTVLPGAVVGGDVLRGYELHRFGNPLAKSALSVLVDRATGLWVLCAVSLVAVLGIIVAQAAGWVDAEVSGAALTLAAAMLALACAVPLLLARLTRRAPRRGPLLAISRRAIHAVGAVARLRDALPRLLAMSIVVQVLAATALCVYARSASVEIAFPVVLAAAAPIFVMAALPVGYAGFGARELAAVAVLGIAGVPADGAAAAGLLYGIGALLQGALGAGFFLAGLEDRRTAAPRRRRSRRLNLRDP